MNPPAAGDAENPLASFAERFRKAINTALPLDRRLYSNVARVMGDRYADVANGTVPLTDPEIDQVAAMLGVSPTWLRTGQAHPFIVGTLPLGDDPTSLLRILSGHNTPWGPVQSIVFVACAYPAYGSVLIICEYEGTALNPHRYSIIRTTTPLDAPRDGAWTWQPGALLLNMAFLSRLHVRRGGFRGQGMMSIIVSDDTY
ncbi:hypothetical protein, partial [Acidiphilium sp.]|uniref:hypothetical protein n=1 Tax=Acidiphilium sp. TaxID=527 RepID=UPI003D036F24